MIRKLLERIDWQALTDLIGAAISLTLAVTLCIVIWALLRLL